VLRFGNSPYLECSTRGDRRFSAFYACPASLNGQSIEQAYQAMKVLEDGSTGHSPAVAKGKRAINVDECTRAYAVWWWEYVNQMGLLPELQAASGLSDVFGKPGHVCQAEVLWRIRNGWNPR
jgi:hypothetical protein